MTIFSGRRTMLMAAAFPNLPRPIWAAAGISRSEQAFDLVAAYQLNPRPEYLDAILMNLNYEGGCNPVNITYVTGLGWKRQLNIVDQYSANDRRAHAQRRHSHRQSPGSIRQHVDVRFRTGRARVSIRNTPTRRHILYWIAGVMIGMFPPKAPRRTPGAAWRFRPGSLRKPLSRDKPGNSPMPPSSRRRVRVCPVSH